MHLPTNARPIEDQIKNDVDRKFRKLFVIFEVTLFSIFYKTKGTLVCIVTTVKSRQGRRTVTLWIGALIPVCCEAALMHCRLNCSQTFT